jgi:uncharacterized protein (DUF58 family)
MDGVSATPYRRFLVLAAALAALLGLRTRSSALLGMAVAWAAMLLLAWARREGALRGLRVRREMLGNAFEDDVVLVDLLLENHGQRATRLVLIADAFGASLNERQVVLEPGPLPGRHRRRLQYRSFCSRPWGVYAVGPLTLVNSDPMGLFLGRRTVERIDTLAVYPRVHDIAGLGRLGGRATLAPEDMSAARVGRSALHLGVRDYGPGDDVRGIHWPATARRGAPMMREREVDLIPQFTLFVDLHKAGRTGVGRKSTLEYLVRVGASLLWSAARGGYRLQVVGEGSRPLIVPAGRGEVHLAHALYELIRVQQDGEVPLLEVVERFRPLLPAGSAAALLSATAVDLSALTETLEALRVTAVRPLLVFVDADSFLPMDHLPLPRAQVEARRGDLLGFIRSQGLLGAVLHSEQDLAQELVRPDLLG